TVTRLASHLKGSDSSSPKREAPRRARKAPANDDRFAIVGLSCRLPGARDADEFWRNIRDGVESITRFSEEELRSAGVDEARLKAPNYVKARGVLADTQLFDAAFFGMSPREAVITDPAHRLFLECAWEAMESAGYTPKNAGRVGVYAGAGHPYYSYESLQPNRQLMSQYTLREHMVGNLPDYLAGRVSFALNLTGPSVAVQAACATSLVAMMLACRSLAVDECDMALAGGASVNPYVGGYLSGYEVSPDGHCRPFDANGGGPVPGDGVGVIVIKRLADAVQDRDPILAVIRGFGLNNDGAEKALRAQADDVREAFDMAKVSPDSVTYVETHGSGTVLGDQVEIASLTRVFRESTKRKGFCAIGSVKSNFGTLEQAAGAAGLIKTILALKNKQLPPNLHFDRPNPEIDFANSPF